MGDGYTKLFNSVLVSSIWGEPDHVRIVWITMLAMADQDGVVSSTIPGLSRMANKSIEETQDALNILTSPDPYSRTKNMEGRRILATNDGWEIVNYLKYREKASAEDRRKKTAERVRKHRERNACNADVTQCNASVTPSNACNDKQMQKQMQKEEGEGERASAPPPPAKPEYVSLSKYPLLKLTQGELDTLGGATTPEVAKEYLGRLNDYLGSTGKRYKSHYYTIRNWLRKDGVIK